MTAKLAVGGLSYKKASSEASENGWRPPAVF
jgi:hypothetical protein